jgi:prepilin-type N-terminal cleavage/methylation domain-containing protein
MRNKGVTLVELLIVIVVIGLISGMAVFTVDIIVQNTRQKVDRENLNTLNTATQRLIEFSGDDDDPFEGIASDTFRIQYLAEQGYIDHNVVAQQRDAEFGWNSTELMWQLFENGNPFNSFSTYDFSSMTLQDAVNDGMITPNSNIVSYDLDAGHAIIERQSGMMLKETNADEYSFSVTISTENTGDTRPTFFFDYNDSGGNLAKGEGFAILFNRQKCFCKKIYNK